MMNDSVKHPTLCWFCANALCGCSWSKHFEPVDGWTAVPTLINQVGFITKEGTRDREAIPSYLVYDCPLYVNG